MWGDDFQYRAIGTTNTTTRRLAYLTSVVSIIGRKELSERALIVGLTKSRNIEAHEHQQQARVNYPPLSASAAKHYLQLARKLGLIYPTVHTYQITRTGTVLYFVRRNTSAVPDILSLSESERLFYTNLLLSADADYLLALAGLVIEHSPAPFSLLQQRFREALVKRLRRKMSSPYIKHVEKSKMLESLKRIETWRKATRYTEHLLCPRLNWLLDLGFLEQNNFHDRRYTITESGRRFLEKLPVCDDYLDVSTGWLYNEFWHLMPPLLLGISLQSWEQEAENRHDLCAYLLEESFRYFGVSFVPRISLFQALMYMSIRLVVDYRIAVSPKQLLEWLTTEVCMFGGDKRAEVHCSPAENASYLLAVSS